MERPITSAYLARCHKTLKALDAPIDKWTCVGVVDHGKDCFTCQLCGCKKVRYIHMMRHEKYPDAIPVGCICAGVMEGDILSAQKRDLEARRKSQRKSNFLKKPWKAVSENCWELCYKRRKIIIERDSFRGREFYKIHLDGEQYQWKDNRRMNSFLIAQHMVFDLLELEMA